MIVAGGIQFRVQEDPHSLNTDLVPGTVLDAGKCMTLTSPAL